MEKECINLPLCFTPFPFSCDERTVKTIIVSNLRDELVWPTTCTYMVVQMILASLSNLPETMGLFLVGLVLIISGIVLRRVFLTLGTAVPVPGQNVESKEHPLK